MAGFFRKLFGQGNAKVKVDDRLTEQGLQAEADLWNNNVAVRNKEGAKKMMDDAADIALHENIGTPINPEGGNTRA